MALEFKKQDPQPVQNKGFEEVTYTSTEIGLPVPPIGIPMGFPSVHKISVNKKAVPPPPLALPGSDLKRAINYLADYSGCGWWRLGAPELLLNYGQKMIISSLTTMVVDPRFYTSGFCAIKLQRQATPVQKEFVKFLKVMGTHFGAKVCYELDDVVLEEDIPLYNRCRDAFTDPEIRKSITDMMDMCDEMVVVSPYMRDYYKSKINNKKIVYIPNYAPRMWFDRYYNEDEILKNYEKNKKRPKILITASGTHFDVINRTNQSDDYTHVLQSIIKSRKDFEWTWMGGYPLLLRPFIDNGEMIFKDWSPLLQFATGMHDVGAQATIAALADNHFNRAKSFIKLTEAGHLGLPFAGQDMECYKDAFHKFTTGDEMIDQIKQIVKDETIYMKESRKARKYADGFWLDDHLEEHIAFYTTSYGDLKRKEIAPILVNNNPEQFQL
jgi:glycosyltransferase involved in cell wall biosynthesis